LNSRRFKPIWQMRPTPAITFCMTVGTAAGDVRLIGFGEAAMAFAGDPCGPAWQASAYDIKTDDPRLCAGKWADYDRLGVTGAETLAAALAMDGPGGNGLILSLVTAGQTLAVANATAGHLRAGTLYLDMNSAAPATKRAAAARIAAAGGRYVDVAVMAPVHPACRAVPLLLSGSDAAAGAAALSALGFSRVDTLDGEIGAASSVKMIRSVMIKGLEALTAECALAAHRAGVMDAVSASLGPGWADELAYRLERMTSHGLRRAEEMAEVAATLSALGVPPAMASAVQGWQQQIGSMRLDAALVPGARLAAIDAALGTAGRRDAA
jgi:3-hydroxyisobutyrate dehydrogenase-like beta-hydroxyacid dehydrogenase